MYLKDVIVKSTINFVNLLRWEDDEGMGELVEESLYKQTSVILKV